MPNQKADDINKAVIIELLEEIIETIDKSEEWWMSSPGRGGFDLEKIESLLLLLREKDEICI